MSSWTRSWNMIPLSSFIIHLWCSEKCSSLCRSRISALGSSWWQEAHIQRGGATVLVRSHGIVWQLQVRVPGVSWHGMCRMCHVMSPSAQIFQYRGWAWLNLPWQSFLDVVSSKSLDHYMYIYESRSKWLKTTLVLQDFFVRDVQETL